MAAAVASHHNAKCAVCVCARVCICVHVCAFARTIGHLCGRTENDCNSSHYSRSKKGAYLSFSPIETVPTLPVAASFPLRCPIAHERDGMNWRSMLFHEGFPGD